MQTIVMVIVAFFSGSLPFSVWLGKMLLGKDIRRYGDGNPGATNAFRAGNKLVGLLALISSISEAAAPVGWAYYHLGIRGAGMLFIAIAPLVGHIFSPFLQFRGGKGLATALGVWIGLTLWRVSLPALAGAVFGISLFTPPGWSVIAALAGILFVLLVWLPNPLLLAVWLGETLILIWTHRLDLKQGIHLRVWLKDLFSQLNGQRS